MLPDVVMEVGVVADPELRFTPQGVAVVKLRVVAKDRKRDENGVWADGDASFLDVTAWRRLAENIAESVAKGDTLLVAGRLKVRDYERADGSKGTATEVTANSVGVSLLWNPAKSVRPEVAAAPVAGSPAAPAPADPSDPWATAVAPAQPSEPPF